MNRLTQTERMECPICGGTRWNFIDSQGTKWGNAECVVCGIVSPEVRTGYDLSADAEWHADAIGELQRVVETSLLAPMREAWGRYVEFMEWSYGTDFVWTCEYLAELDRMLGDGRHISLEGERDD
jgi:hypothetical protein